MQETPPQKWFLAGCSSHPPCYSPNTSRRFALGANNVCLVGENPTCSSRHCRDATVYGHTTTAMHEIEYIFPIEYTPAPPESTAKPLREPRRKQSMSIEQAIQMFCLSRYNSFEVALDGQAPAAPPRCEVDRVENKGAIGIGRYDYRRPVMYSAPKQLQSTLWLLYIPW